MNKESILAEAALLPVWGLHALWRLQASPFRVTFKGIPLRAVLEARAALHDAASKS